MLGSEYGLIVAVKAPFVRGVAEAIESLRPSGVFPTVMVTFDQVVSGGVNESVTCRKNE